MKSLHNGKLALYFFMGLTAGVIITAASKPPVIEVKEVYTYVKTKDWKDEKNPKKLAYYEHLLKTK